MLPARNALNLNREPMLDVPLSIWFFPPCFSPPCCVGSCTTQTVPKGKSMIRQKLLYLCIVSSLLVCGCGREVFTGKREARGMWMSRFEYASKSPDSAKGRITRLFEKARHAKFNMVFLQVRGNGDAY